MSLAAAAAEKDAETIRRSVMSTLRFRSDESLLACRLRDAYALAVESGHGEVDRWKNVALVVMRLAREGRIPTGG